MIPVVWLWLNDERHEGFWDWGLLKEMFDKSDYDFEHHHTDTLIGFDFAVVVIPGAAHQHQVDKINMELARTEECIVIITSDEERLFPYRSLQHPKMKLYLGYGQPGDEADLFLPLGARDGFIPSPNNQKTVDVGFLGQAPTDDRKALVSALRGMDGDMKVTGGFGQGSQEDYAYRMSKIKIAPAPHGTVHPDSFRLYEAMESACIPVVRDDEYWRFMEADYWSVEDWGQLPDRVKQILPSWKPIATKAAIGWQWKKRTLRKQLEDDIEIMSGLQPPRGITVLIPTSPIPSHPDTSIIEETVKSVRDRLPDSEIIVMCDGVRDEQKSFKDDYEEYQRRLYWLSREYDFMILRSDEHRHQAAMTAYALALVETPLILFVEHDTPLCEEIPFKAISDVILDDKLDVVRFHFESHILPVHRHLMRGQLRHNGITYNKTVQWSQRPHLASTAYYKKLITSHFLNDEKRIRKTMIEDKAHGVAQEYPDQHRIGIYRPKGNIKRSYHTDGRGSESKFEDTFEL